jgi:UDP-galactopyranose mutase
MDRSLVKHVPMQAKPLRKFDWIIAGAGFTGATLAERIATQMGEKVLVVDRRDHIGGNAYDATNDRGILVHRYGPHIFHTNSEKVRAYLSRFTQWRPYVHEAVAVVDGRFIALPFNINSIEQAFPPALAARHVTALLSRYREGERVPVLKLRQEDGDLGALGAFIYEKIFRNYTVKQWGLTPEELSPSVTARVPVVVARDNRYFHDTFQAMPAAGYTPMFERMLDHPCITVDLRTEFRDARARHPSARVIFTGQIDEYFEFCFGPLPYRSLRFEPRTVDVERAQPAAIVNYPDAKVAHTRVTEMRRLTGQPASCSTRVFEYPAPYIRGANEPYYPIPRDQNQVLLNRYLALAKTREDVFICGRLGDYKYYNMDQAVAAALALFGRISGEPDSPD